MNAQSPAIRSMEGKTVLITGANSGVGFATARELAQRGARVVMVCRDSVRGEVAREQIAKSPGATDPIVLLADLSSQAEVRRLADDVRTRFQSIDVLINNAGAVFSERELSVEGIEKTFAINHLAPFLLTNLLFDLVREAPAGRIVTVGSRSYSSALDFEDLQSEKGHHFLFAYFKSKLENILFTYELARRCKGTGVTANCLCPGPTRTGFGDNLQGWPRLFPLLMKQIPFLFSSPEKGARTSIYLASSPEVAGVSGRFFMDCGERRTRPYTHNLEVARRLWRVSEELVGLSGSLAAQNGRA
jgi:NAD(P)-dependent dehydrogenase (short-subunit alcohol dehydrogenase family)